MTVEYIKALRKKENYHERHMHGTLVENSWDFYRSWSNTARKPTVLGELNGLEMIGDTYPG